MAGEKKRGLIVGAGFMGSTHLICYLSDPRVEIKGIIDTDENKASAIGTPHGIAAYKTIGEAFDKNDSIDFVDVCLPSSFHKKAVVEALTLGANVIVEKPFSVKIEEAEEMISAANKFCRRLMVAHVCRFMPQYSLTKKIIDSKTLGKPFAFQAFRESDAPAWSWNNWFQNRALSGGTLLDLSIHDIDIANWFLGKPKEFKAVVSTLKEKAGSEYISSEIVYENGGCATIIASHLMPKEYPLSAGFRLVFEKGCIDWNNGVAPNGCLMISKDRHRELIDIPKNYFDCYSDPYRTELLSFISSLFDGKPFLIDPEEALLAVRTVHNLYDNSEEVTVS